MEELRFVEAPYELCLRRREQPVSPAPDPLRREESDAGTSRPTPVDSSSKVPRKKSYVLLRSPEVGIWSPPADPEYRAAGEKPASAGTVHTLLGDKRLLPPCRGKADMWLVAGGEAVGYGTPVALWEVD